MYKNNTVSTSGSWDLAGYPVSSNETALILYWSTCYPSFTMNITLILVTGIKLFCCMVTYDGLENFISLFTHNFHISIKFSVVSFNMLQL